MPSTPQTQTTTTPDYPPELDAFARDRIEHDLTWYAHFVTEDAFFYDAYEDHVYTITNTHTKYTFDLRSCESRGSNTPTEHPDPNTSNPIDNICTLAGDYELGDTIPLPQGELRIVDDIALLNVGEFVLRFPSNNAAAQLRNWLNLEDAESINIGTLKSHIEAKTTDLTATDTDITVYHPPTAQSTPVPSASTPTTRDYNSEDLDIETRFVPVQRFSKWTFDDPSIKKWAEEHLNGRVLNVCAGQNRLNHDAEIVRNDINPDRTADLHVDAGELAAHLEKHSFDTILFDPPWSLYQSNLRYDGEHVTKGTNTNIDTTELPFNIPDGREKTQLGHARLAKEGFDYLLKPGGKVLQLTFHGTCMPGRLGYNRVERAIFDPIGEGKSVIGSVDQKMQNDLEAYV